MPIQYNGRNNNEPVPLTLGERQEPTRPNTESCYCVKKRNSFTNCDLQFGDFLK